MILQALTVLYEDLVEQGKLPRSGWSPVKVSYVLYINDDGEIVNVASLKEEESGGGKKAALPEFYMPEQVKRTNIQANFLCDNSKYILGVDKKDDPQRSIKCFETCKSLHKKLLGDLTVPAAKALLAFFDKHDPETVATDAVFGEYFEDIIGGGNIIFRYGGEYLHEVREIREAWREYRSDTEGKEQGICLVTGKKGTVARLHPSVKGIYGAQSSGASLVSFNSAAFCSYGLDQGMNAPTGEYAASAYGAALNYLISDRRNVNRIGDTTVLCWSSGGKEEYRSAFSDFLFGTESRYSASDLKGMIRALCRGESVDYEDSKLEPETDFFVLGLSPNSSRLSVRFFLRNSFGNIVKNINAHYERLEIQKPINDTFDDIPLWKLLQETVNLKSKDKSASPQLAGDLLKAIISDSPYPATLINGVNIRIEAERKITRGRAAIIKAYYLKNKNKDIPEEVLKVSLNRGSTNVPYVLGRLFSVLEDIQTAANPGINTTITDKYFSSASSTPAVVFPTLIDLSKKHLKKLDTGRRIGFEKKLGEIFDILGDAFPARLTLPERGAFQLGYYHQTQDRYTKKQPVISGSEE